jgi:3-phenylpropionate/trans-cinnamate dioxygenase ferredoxin reductase component
MRGGAKLSEDLSSDFHSSWRLVFRIWPMKPNGVLIAGGGLAAQRCAERLRRRGFEGPIRVVCEERRRPYDRPPLSKELLAGDERGLEFRSRDWYRDSCVELLLGERAASLDPARRTLALESGEELLYDHLLIATGATPRILAAANRFANSFALRTLDHAVALRRVLFPGARLAIVGAGFIGLEVAATARGLGAEVTVVEAADLPLSGIVGVELGRWFADMHAAEGVRLLLSSKVSSFRGNGRVEELVLASGRTIPCDALVIAIGVDPALDWLRGSGLDTNGIPVDPAGRTSLPGVYAAGDAARPFEPAVGGHVRSEHWEAAAASGAAAADGMLGLSPAARPPSSFWSDQYGVRIQYLGHAQLADSVGIDGDLTARDFTAIFTRRGRPVAALIAGRPRALPKIRHLIAKGNEDGLPG